MDAGEPRYETKTVKVVRGAEGRTVDKWQAGGWEVVSRSTGTVRTEIRLRRPIHAVNVRPYLIAGAGLALVIATGASVSALTHRAAPSASQSVSEGHQATASAASATAASVTTTQGPSRAESASTSAAQTGLKPLTTANSPELAAILADHENCSDSVEAFARKHAGETIAFDGNIAALQRHGDTATRYDILVGVGAYSTRTAVGPTFQFRDVNVTNDLHLTGADPGVIRVGDNVHVVATVHEYVPASCLFLIEPVTTTMR